MLQRKQTLFLLVGLAAMIFLLFASLGTFANEKGIFDLRFYGLRDITQAGNPQFVTLIWPLTLLICLTTILQFIDIFLFKNRPLQMRVAGINAGLFVGTAVMMFVVSRIVASEIAAEWHFDFTVILPVIGMIFNLLAYRAISDDEALIRSLNRLR